MIARITAFSLGFALSVSAALPSLEIPLAGEWRVVLERERGGEALAPPSAEDFAAAEPIRLPATLGVAGLGNAGVDDPGTARLAERHSFTGRAWYRREIEIPAAAAGRDLYLSLERTKVTRVWLDGSFIGGGRHLCVPQRFVLPAALTGEGGHVLTVMVDNGRCPELPDFTFNSHQNSDQTQTNWNGIIGRMSLTTESDAPAPALQKRENALAVDGRHFTSEGRRVFLRGKHDGCVFPLTGHPPMEKEGWLDYFGVVREWGFNHVRFHSWCPPRAAFEAADELGIFLQPELPIWGRFAADEEDPAFRFLLEEGLAILREYGAHRSFAMFCLGNELSAGEKAMRMLVDRFREAAPEKLYTFAAWPHLGGLGIPEGEDYLISARIGARDDSKGFANDVRGSFSHVDNRDGGLINATEPGGDRDFSRALRLLEKPVLGHETAQFQFYPDARELPRYSGALEPLNLKRMLDRAREKHGPERVEEFFQAVGPLAVRCYKEDFEMARRTPQLAGFQTLDLQDFPGQGTALVGPLNAFMENKGFIRAEEFRAFNGDVVALARFPKFVWGSEETFRARAQVSNFSPAALDACLRWRLRDEAGRELASGELAGEVPQGVLGDLGEIGIALDFIRKPTRLDLSLELEGADAPNSWPLWVYPPIPDQAADPAQGPQVFSRPDEELFATLRSGGRAVLFAEEGAFPEQTLPRGLFVPCFWNYSMFHRIAGGRPERESPGTLGLLIRPQHPALASFPSSFHSDWQWWPLMKFAEPLVLDGVKRLRPIVEPIDNVERCHRLGLLFEVKVGPGRLLVCMADLPKALANNYRGQREIRQLHASIMDYAKGPRFEPGESLEEEELRLLFSAEKDRREIEGWDNKSY